MDVAALRLELWKRKLKVRAVLEKAGVNFSKFYRKVKDDGDKLSLADAKKIAKAMELSEEKILEIFWR